MRQFPVYVNPERKIFILMGVYYVLGAKYYSVLNLDEETLQSWTAEKIIGSTRICFWTWMRMYDVFYKTYNKIKYQLKIKPWSFTDEEYMHVNGLLKSAQSGITILATHIPLRFF